MRINQFIASKTGMSRRDADKAITAGQVEYNGDIATPGQVLESEDVVRVYKGSAWITLNNRNNSSKTETILFYKPIFSITSKSDPQKRKTIYNFLPRQFHDLKPAGRLDYMSEGLLVMSNDGELIHSLTHPSMGTHKVYLVGLDKPLETGQIVKAERGMSIEDGKLEPVVIKHLADHKAYKFNFLKLESNYYWYEFILNEGKNNQIRKMAGEFTRKVRRLIRIQDGQYLISKDLYLKKYLAT